MSGLVNGLGGPETKGNVLNGRQELTLQRNRSHQETLSSASDVDLDGVRFLADTNVVQLRLDYS
ncbi:hypothetical protein RYX36_016224 [Vicia faba]